MQRGCGEAGSASVSVRLSEGHPSEEPLEVVLARGVGSGGFDELERKIWRGNRFNWAACLLPPIYFAYRRCWGAAIALFAVNVALQFARRAITPEWLTSLSGVAGLAIVAVPLMVGIVLPLAISVGAGFGFGPLYRRRATRIYSKAREAGKDEVAARYEVAKAGGTSWPNVVIMSILAIAASVILTIWVPGEMGKAVVSEVNLPIPDRIVVHEGSTQQSIVRGGRSFDGLYGLFSRVPCRGALASSVDPDEDLIAGSALEFEYDSEMETVVPDGRGNTVSRKFDRALFCFAGGHAGELVFGKNDTYQSGTISHPFIWEAISPVFVEI